jgi:predicted outer membrane protein
MAPAHRWATAPVEVEMGRWLLTRPISVALAAGVAILAGLSPAAVAAPPTPTQLNMADMTLLNGVRQAGLWEIPAGQMAAQRGSTARIRQVGAMIAEQHVRLDQLVVDAANKLGATIPSTPTTDQQGWLNDMQKATGSRFDQTFVDRLRAAHGKIFPVIGAVRAATRNPVIRALADQANTFVMNHMKMLESTGLVQYQKLAPAALPAAQDTSQLALARANAGTGPPVSPVFLWSVLVVMLACGTVAGVRLFQSRRY